MLSYMTVSGLQQAISRFWGYSSFRPLQKEAMDAVLAGRDSIVVLPTGGGKSLCFQAPAVVHSGIAVVVSPLISLMKDQVDTLVGNGVPAALFNSSLTSAEKSDVVAGLRQGRYKLLYVSPERLVGEGSDSFLAMLSTVDVSFVAVDEAHCISQWGHDFRPEYRQLGRLRQLLPGVSLHAYTATATARVRRDIATQLGLDDPIEFVGSFDRPNLRVPRPSTRHAQETADRSARTPPPRSRHRLLHVAPRSRRARRVAQRRSATRPFPITQDSRTPSEAGIRTPSSASGPTSSSPPWPSGWASIARTCGSSCTPALRVRSSTISRSRDVPVAMASKPSACSSIRRPTS